MAMLSLPHGKVAGISLPLDWNEYVGDNVSKFVKQENGDTVADGPDGTLLSITTVPPRPLTGPEDPAGYVEFLYMSEQTRNKVFNYPGFPQPLANPKVPKHEIREAPGKGLGVYATCDMWPGDLIWSERPLIVTPALSLGTKGGHIGDHHTHAEAMALRLYAGERTYEAIVNRLTPERKVKFMSLWNSHLEDGSGPCGGVIRTNQLELKLIEKDPGPNIPNISYAAVAYDLSRINHSCIPNISYGFDFASFSLRIYAFGRIKKGDELVWSYVNRDQSTLQRQEGLSPYGFKCDCRRCAIGVYSLQIEAMWSSYTFRAYTATLPIMISLLKEDLGNHPFHKKSYPEKQARLVEYNQYLVQLEALKRESDSYGSIPELYILCLLHELYRRVGNQNKKLRYANLVVRWMRCMEIETAPKL